MPFRCKCGQTFERPDSFQSHTSACPRFHSTSTSTSTPSSPTTPGALGTPGTPGGSLGATPTPIRKNSISSIIINTTSFTQSFGGQPSPSLSSSLSTSPSPSAFYSPGSPNSPYSRSNSLNLGLTSISSPDSLDFVPTSHSLMPASLSLQSTFAAARRRSMSATSLQAQN